MAGPKEYEHVSYHCAVSGGSNELTVDTGRAAKEISHYTSQPGLVLSKTAFKGIVNALTQLNGYNLDKDDPDNNDDRSLETYHMGKIHDRLYFTEDAMETLQDVVEQFLVNEFNLAAHEQINQSRLTLLPRDLHKVAVNRYEMDHSAPKRFYAIDETFPRMLTHDQAIKEGVYWDRTWYDERLTKEEMKALGFGDEEEVTKWDRQEANSDARNERSKAAAAERAREEEERKKRSEALKAQREKRAEKRGPPGSRKKLIGKIGKPTDDNGKGGKGPGGK